MAIRTIIPVTFIGSDTAIPGTVINDMGSTAGTMMKIADGVGASTAITMTTID